MVLVDIQMVKMVIQVLLEVVVELKVLVEHTMEEVLELEVVQRLLVLDKH